MVASYPDFIPLGYEATRGSTTKEISREISREIPLEESSGENSAIAVLGAGV